MTNSSDPISSIQSIHLGLPPSCLEFCPIHPSYFLVGTYNLQKDDEVADAHEGGAGDEDTAGEQDGSQQVVNPKLQSRNGSILVFNLTKEGL